MDAAHVYKTLLSLYPEIQEGKMQKLNKIRNLHVRCAKNVVSDSLGLVDIAIGLVNSVFNLPDGQVMFF